jgi:hypothetical protein
MVEGKGFAGALSRIVIPLLTSLDMVDTELQLRFTDIPAHTKEEEAVTTFDGSAFT